MYQHILNKTWKTPSGFGWWQMNHWIRVLIQFFETDRLNRFMKINQTKVRIHCGLKNGPMVEYILIWKRPHWDFHKNFWLWHEWIFYIDWFGQIHFTQSYTIFCFLKFISKSLFKCFVASFYTLHLIYQPTMCRKSSPCVVNGLYKTCCTENTLQYLCL